MNVIIRLQNLPWSANATDIRNFFKGLMIPEGGVHIVGGENGDAFIAFSSDEDARQAMQLNGGKIKETQVSLLLSSRAEMQKVIEKARQASSSAFAITKMSTQTQSAATIANQFAKKLPEAAAVVPPQPPIISLSSYLAQSMQQQQAPPQVSVTQPQQINLMSAYQTALVPNDMSGLGGLASLPPVGLPAAQNAAAVAAYYATLMGPNAAMAYANPIAAGLNVKSPAESLLKSSTYLGDPRGERNRYRSRSPERRSSRRSRSNSRDRYPSDSDGKDGSRRRTRFSAAQDRVEVPKHSALPPVISSSSNSFSIPPPSNIWEHPPPQVFSHEVNAQPTNMNAYAFNYNNASALPTPRNNYKTENSSNLSNASSGSLGNIGTCVKVSNVDSETFYSDLRKFFAGLPIGTNDIKFVNDAKGNRTGAALIRFVSSDSKKKALTKSMWQLKSTQVVITSISEEDFESGMVNVKSANRGNQGNSYRNDDRFDSRNDRFRDRSDSRERDYPKRDRFEGNRGGNHRFDDRPHNNNRDGGNFRQREQNDRLPPRNYRSEDQEKPKEYQPDENFSVLIIDDIPRTANEPDICEAFPNIVSIVIDRYKAYVKFTSHETAKATLENRYIHYIRNKRVFLEAGSEAQFNELARKNGKFDNSENKEGNDNGNGSANAFEPNDDSNSHDSSRNQKPFESRDPRQRNFANDRRNDFPSNGNGGAPNQIKTDCIIMKNMEPDTTIEEVENFFKDLGIFKMRVHILLDKRGQPCGDCFVEFKFPNDANRAIVKNQQQMRSRNVTVMLIPREQVQAVLSSFGNDDRPQQSQEPPMNMQNRNRRNDWAPPSDFGTPGCVVMLSNLCYRATTDDILDCFREFELHPDNVIRRFNDMGQPTGNACVNFNCEEDAEMALDKYSSVKIMDRPVWLKRA